MTLVTLSAAYGAGGSRIGPALAEELGVDFVDRIIPARVAQRLAVPVEEALARDQAVETGFTRLLMRLAPIGQVYGAHLPHDRFAEEAAYRRETERVLREHADSGRGVILGRAGAVVLADDPRALHVRLDGARSRRIEQAMRIDGVNRETAERRLRETDRAREAYVQEFYGVDARDASLYHLVIDATTLPLDTCVQLIALAARARR